MTRSGLRRLAGGVLLALVLAFLCLHLPQVQRRALSWAISRLERTGIVLKAGGLDYNLFTRTVRVRDLTLAAAGAASEPFFSASDVQASLGWGIFAGHLEVTQARVTRGAVLFHRRADGSHNWPSSRTDGPRRQELHLPVATARIDGLDVRWTDDAIGWGLRAGLSGEVSTEAADTAARLAMSGPSSLTWRGRDTAITSLDAAVGWNGRDLAVRALSIGVKEGTVRADGRLVTLLDQPQVDAQVTTDVDLAMLGPWVNVSRAVGGRARAEVRVTGPLRTPVATVALSGRDVSIESVPVMAIDAGMRLTTSAVDLTALRVGVAGGTVTGDGRTSFDGPGSLRLNWNDVDPSVVLERALEKPPGLLPASRTRGSLQADWKAPAIDQLTLAVKGDVRRSGGSASRVPVDGAFNLDVNGRRWRLSMRDVAALGARLSTRVGGLLDAQAFRRSTVGGDVQLLTVDLGELSRSLSRTGSAPRVSGTARGAFTVGGTLGAPSLDGPVAAEIQHGSIGPVAIAARARVTAEGADLGDLDARMAASAARGTARWSFRTGAVAAALTSTMAAADLAGLTTLIPREWPASGTLDVSASISGPIARPRIVATAAATGLEMAGQHADRLAADVTLDTARASVLAVDRLIVEDAGGRLELRGSIDLTRDSYDAHVVATDAPVRPLPGATPDSALSARASGAFDGKGTFKDLGGSGRFTLTDVRWGARDLGRLTADASLAGRDVRIAFNAPDLALQGDATAGIDAGATLSARGRWTPGDVEAIARHLGLAPEFGVGGSADLRFDLSAPRDDLEAARGRVNLDRLDLVVDGKPLRLARAGQLDYDGRVVRVDDIRLAVGGSSVALTGAVGAPGSGGLTATAEGSLEDFAFLWETAADPERRTSAGTLKVQLRADGTFPRPDVSGTFQIADGRIPIPGAGVLSGLGLSGSFARGVLAVDRAGASYNGASMTASARVPSGAFVDRLPASVARHLTPVDGPATLSARIMSLTPAVAAPFVDPAALSEIAASADASIELEADRLSLDRVRGAITLDRAESSIAGVNFDQQAPTRIVLRDGRAAIEAWDWGTNDHRFSLRGSATLAADPALDVTATGTLALRMLSLFVPSLGAAGLAEADIRFGGTVRSPTLDGQIALDRGELRLASPRLVVGEITGTVKLAGDTLSLEGMSATVNGGDATITGSIRHRAWVPTEGALTLNATGASLDLSGLRAEANASVSLTVAPRGPVIGGTVTLVRSSFNERLSVTSGILRALRNASTAASVRPRSSSAIDRIALDVRIVTEEDLLVDNNLARLEVASDLRLVGTLQQPALSGRATIAEGGQVFFAGNRYRLPDQGSVDFADLTRIEPDFDVRAVTKVQGNEITVAVKGTPSTLQTTLTSDNSQLSQSDLVSLIVLGHTASGADETEMGNAEMLGFLSSGLLGAAGRAIGFDTVRVERGTPDLRFDAGLVATETNPTARLTFGKNIGSRTEVIFSQSLEQSEGLTWIVSFTPRAGFNFRVVSSDQTDHLVDFTHEVTFGSGRRPPRRAAEAGPTVSRVTITGADADEARLRSALKLGPGKRFSFSEWQNDRDRIEKFYDEQGRFEARIGTRRVADAADSSRIELTYDVRPGPRTAIDITGASLSGATFDDMRRAWGRAVVDRFAAEEVAGIARAALADQGYVQAAATAEIARADGEKRMRVTIAPGEKAGERRVEFAGNRHEPSKRLLAVLEPPELTRAVWLDPDRVADALGVFYVANGYLDAKVSLEPVAMSSGVATRVIRVEEGEASRLKSIRVEGAATVPPDDVRKIIALTEGEVFTEAKINQAALALDRSYRSRGFNSVRVVHEATAVAGAPQVEVVVRVDEGLQQRLRSVEITGLERTRQALVKRALALNLGEPVNLAAWSASRRRMYETSAFRSVDIEPVVTKAQEPAASPAEEPVRALVSVQEWPLLRLRYGIDAYNELRSGPEAVRSLAPSDTNGERRSGLGITGDLAARNLFGVALSAGVAGRYTPDFRAGRVYATTPLFFGHRITTNAFVERSREEFGATADNLPAFFDDKTTITVEQRVRPLRKTEVSYRYSLERERTLPQDARESDVRLIPVTTTAHLASSVVVDTRDDLIDSTRGLFHASNVDYSPPVLGSDVRFVKYLLQQRYYRAAGPVVFATSLRLGLAAVSGQLPSDDRFFAGGGNSVRGYAEDSLSPRDITNTTVGGNALAVFNQEVRFPMHKWVRGVGFLDAGRAFDEVRHLSFGDLAVGAGLGVRIVTPVVLLRLDAGYPFDASAGTRRLRWFFSIGQSF